MTLLEIQVTATEAEVFPGELEVLNPIEVTGVVTEVVPGEMAEEARSPTEMQREISEMGAGHVEETTDSQIAQQILE